MDEYVQESLKGLKNTLKILEVTNIEGNCGGNEYIGNFKYTTGEVESYYKLVTEKIIHHGQDKAKGILFCDRFLPRKNQITYWLENRIHSLKHYENYFVFTNFSNEN